MSQTPRAGGDLMKLVLFLAGVAAFGFGVLTLASSQSAIHEILVFVLFLLSAVLIAAAVIVERLQAIEVELKKANQK